MLQVENQTRIQNLGIFRTLVCSKPWHIQNQRHVHDLIYSEPRHINNPSIFRTPEYFAETVNILYEINTINVFNASVIFTPIAFILCRKSMGAQWAGGHEFRYTLK